MKTGVYQIISLIDNRFYIGSSIDVDVRFNTHLYELQNNKHHNKHLQRVFNKYGKENFKFEVLEYCESEIRIEREQFYIDNFIVNKVKLFNQILIVRELFNHDFETNQKRVKGLKRFHKNLNIVQKTELLNKSLKSEKCELKRYKSVELYFQKNKEKHLLNSIHSERVKELQKKKWRKIVMLNKETLDLIGTFDSITLAAEFVNGSCSNICTICKTFTGTYRGYIWRYKEDFEQRKLQVA